MTRQGGARTMIAALERVRLCSGGTRAVQASTGCARSGASDEAWQGSDRRSATRRSRCETIVRFIDVVNLWTPASRRSTYRRSAR